MRDGRLLKLWPIWVTSRCWTSARKSNGGFPCRVAYWIGPGSIVWTEDSYTGSNLSRLTGLTQHEDSCCWSMRG